jgi:hypothetical protein
MYHTSFVRYKGLQALLTFPLGRCEQLHATLQRDCTCWFLSGLNQMSSEEPVVRPPPAVELPSMQWNECLICTNLILFKGQKCNAFHLRFCMMEKRGCRGCRALVNGIFR